MNKFLFSIFSFCSIVLTVGCVRDDSEPERVRKPISRLYVSTSDYSSNSASTDMYNVWYVDSVDVDVFPENKVIGEFTSAAKGGKMIHYSPFSDGALFQSSMNPRESIDTAIHVMSISKVGVLSNNRSIKNRLFDDVRGLYYTVVNSGQVSESFLLVANASQLIDPTSASRYNLYAIRRPLSVGDFSRPRFKLPLEYNPWGVLGIDDDIIVSNANDNMGGLMVYKGLRKKFLDVSLDTLMTGENTYSLNIDGAKNVRGIAYSKAKDLLLITDYVAGANSQGRILLFEQFSQHTSSKNIVPTRIVTGDLTQLLEPMDVAIDTREDGKYFFVADPAAKKVFRFSISDNGNVAPNTIFDFEGRTPRSISLDAR